jgi:cysteinyl-tRNA synthetase
MVRKANAAIDSGQMRRDDVAPLLAALDKFDKVFVVLQDDDAPKMKAILEWAKTEGREKDVSQELHDAVGTQSLSDAEIETKIAEMEAARRSRNFQASDAIRTELTTAGLLVEITKDGVRWRRK